MQFIIALDRHRWPSASRGLSGPPGAPHHRLSRRVPPAISSREALAAYLSAALGQQFIIDNARRTSNLAAEFVARAPKDGYTFFMATAANLIYAAVIESFSSTWRRTFRRFRWRHGSGVLVAHPLARGEQPDRVDRARQVQARRDFLRFVRRRHHAASGG